MTDSTITNGNSATFGVEVLTLKVMLCSYLDSSSLTSTIATKTQQQMYTIANSSAPVSRSERDMPNSGSDSDDDDDFVPDAEPSHTAVVRSGLSKQGKDAVVATDDPSDSDSDSDADGAHSETQDKPAGASVRAAEQIDADELEALRKEREELVAAAGGEQRLGKRRRLAHVSESGADNQVTNDNEVQALKAKAVAEWEAIKASESGSSMNEQVTRSTATGDNASATTLASTARQEMVSIPTTYKFAGELHTSMRLLPRSHPDALKYLSSQIASPTSTTSSAPAPSASASAPLPTSPASTSTSSSPSRPQPARPAPRRKKPSSLSALSAAATTKPTKLNTLEKSKLDWDTYKSDHSQLSQQELDELEHQTKRGGKGLGDMKGYLDRSDFLDRVKNRTAQP